MSVNVDSSNWRLSTGGIKYKLVNGFPKGSISEESGGQIEEQYIIRGVDLFAFLNLSFPLGVDLDESTYRVSPNRKYPGASAFATSQVSFEPLNDSLPCDPYLIDPRAPLGTYDQDLRISITYTTGKQEEDTNDATTLLEISAESSAEFLTIPVRAKAKWKDGMSEGQQAAYAAAHGGEMDGEEVQDPLSNVTKLIPETQWTVRWPRVNRQFIPTLVAAMRNRMGHVNNAVMPLFHNAPKETVMFMGYSYNEQYTWRVGLENTPVAVNMLFMERHIKQDGKVIGHNHFIQDETGKFTKLWLPNKKPVYAGTNLNNLFPPTIKVND